MRILLISRKYPPTIGGMQTYSKGLVESLSEIYKVDTILLKRGKAHIIWFFPYALFKSIYLILINKYDALYLCDGLLAPIGFIIKTLFQAPVFITVHGLELTFNKFFYQSVIPRLINTLDKVICVSEYTLNECVKRGINKDICVYIPNGLPVSLYENEGTVTQKLDKIQKILHLDLDNKKILVTVGRLVKRKGIDWFIKNVFLNLENDYTYFIVGDGPERSLIAESINSLSLNKRAHILGFMDDSTLGLLYDCAHAFIMPNQRIKDDPEGFGIVAIEAASHGLPTVANLVDGIGNAVLDGKTGWLIECNDKDSFIEKIKNIGLQKEKVRESSKIFSWPHLMDRYKKEVFSCIK